MKRDKLDEILATEDEMVPSSGFAAAVLQKICDEAATPAPIPFPWKRALPGMVLAAAAMGYAGFELVRTEWGQMGNVQAVQVHLPTVSSSLVHDAGWAALALAMSLGSWILSRSVAGRSRLF
ncbi:MAG TPA: hypothetical protein VKR52_08755 [Terracidiphilus sp.]|nr:hypothetical protein [Terracidiphilus sp.]